MDGDQFHDALERSSLGEPAAKALSRLGAECLRRAPTRQQITAVGDPYVSRAQKPSPSQGKVGNLVEAAAQGEQSAWNELVDRYNPLVWSICQRFRLSASDVGDISQIVWLRAVEHLDAIRVPEAFPGWLSAVTRNECLNFLTQHRRPASITSIEVPDEGFPFLDFPDLNSEDYLEHTQAFERLLALIPEKYREAVLLHHGYRPVEIGMKLGIHPRRVTKIKQQIRSALELDTANKRTGE